MDGREDRERRHGRAALRTLALRGEPPDEALAAGRVAARQAVARGDDARADAALVVGLDVAVGRGARPLRPRRRLALVGRRRRAPLDAIRKVCLLLDETHRVAGPQLDARAARRRHAVDRDELVVAAQRHDVRATGLGDQPRVSPRDERRVQLDLGPGTASDRDLTRRREPDEGARARELGHQRERRSRHLSKHTQAASDARRGRAQNSRACG